MDELTSRRFWITRYFMVIGIVILHLPPYQPLGEIDDTLFSFIKAFFAHGLFRATVPVLTVISGYLVFSSGLHRQPLKLLIKKTRSVFIPLVLWNVPIALAIYLSQKYQLLSHAFSAELYPFNPLNWLNAITGALADPVNYPLNFLRDLFVISLLSPMLWSLLKRAPYTGLLLTLIVCYADLDGWLVLRNSMLVNFYVGGLIAIKKWELTRLDSYAIWLVGILIASCAAIVLFRIENRESFRLIAPFLVWPSMQLIADTRLGDWLYKHSGNSFFTFLSHSIFLLVLWMLFKKTPLAAYYPVYWLLTPSITVLFSIFLCREFKQRFPRMANVMLGGRE